MSDKSVAEKLLIKAGCKVLIINAPTDYKAVVIDLPAGAEILEKSSDGADLIQLFIKSKKELEEQLSQIKPLLKPGTLLWLSYPKGTSKMKVDINRDSINAYAKTLGLTGVAMISIDDTWSAMRFKTSK
jgi:ABC-type Fe3+-hydroxamate transport system substrate-binding protein